MSVAGHDMVILNNHKVNADLLEKRANIYSSRPRLLGMSIFQHVFSDGILTKRQKVASEILTGGMLIPFALHDDTYVLLH